MEPIKVKSTDDQTIEEHELKLTRVNINDPVVATAPSTTPSVPATIPSTDIAKEIIARIDMGDKFDVMRQLGEVDKIQQEDEKDLENEFKEHEILNEMDDDEKLQHEEFLSSTESEELNREKMLLQNKSLYTRDVNKCLIIPIYPSKIRTFFHDGQHKDQVVVGCGVQVHDNHYGFIKTIGEQLPGDGSPPTIYSIWNKIGTRHIGYIEHEKGSQYYQSNFIYYRCDTNQTMFWLLNRDAMRKIDAKLRAESEFLKSNSKNYNLPIISAFNNRRMFNGKPEGTPMIPDAVFYKLFHLAPHQPVGEMNRERQRLYALYQKKMELLKSKRTRG